MNASEIHSITVIGAGTMGHGIAHVCATMGATVALFDALPGVAAAAIGKIKKNLDKHSPGYAETFKTKKKETAVGLRKALTALEKLFLSCHDHLLLAQREEEKCIQMLSSYARPHEFFQNYQQITKSLNSVYIRPCKEIDKFKSDFYMTDDFGKIILDICMVDLNTTENRCASLKNMIPLDHERLRVYVGAHLALFKTFEYYARKLAEMLEGKHDWTIRYPEKQLEEIGLTQKDVHTEAPGLTESVGVRA